LYQRFHQRQHRLLTAQVAQELRRGLKGLEKESLRVTLDGDYAQTPHPVALGSALTHPHLTTDYSEALLEFVSPPLSDTADLLQFMHNAHRFVYHHLDADQEILWVNSMPCVVHGDESIPLAWYGTSNAGFMKHVYRRGLGFRYGRVMQVISGVHFNYSVPLDFWPIYQSLENNHQPLQTFINDNYFALIRNLQRFGWLIIYLFGASPALCRSFLAGHSNYFEVFDECTFYEPYGTSLRMSDIGYHNKTPTLNVCYHNLDTYLGSLRRAMNTPHPKYEAIGVRVNGEYRQLNTSVLQIENEYYSTMRPKQVLYAGESPSQALRQRGVRYVELRSLDVNPFAPTGVTETQLRFLEVLLLFCLLQDSPPITELEHEEIEYNQSAVALRGRASGLTLRRLGQAIVLDHWAKELFDALEIIATLIDDPHYPIYSAAIAQEKEKLSRPELTPSAQMLALMRTQKMGFFPLTLQLSLQNAQFFKQSIANPQFDTEFEQLAKRTLLEQAQLEKNDKVSFESYLTQYFNQT
jgi:glutamate--cysteine ligase